jgi:hypothetical protein
VKEYLLAKPDVTVSEFQCGTSPRKQWDCWLELGGISAIGIALRTGNVEFYPNRVFREYHPAEGLDKEVMKLLQYRINPAPGVSYKDDLVIAVPRREAIDWAYGFMESYGSIVRGSMLQGVGSQMKEMRERLRVTRGSD